MHMNYSKPWKHEQIAHEDLDAPAICHMGKKEYLGFFLENRPYSRKELYLIEETLRRSLETYFPSYSSKQLETLLFPQLFLS